MGSWPQLCVAIGLILSTALMAILNGIFGNEAFATWDFRIPFLLSLVLVAIGLYIRLKIMEPPQFTKVIDSQETTTAPLGQALRRFPKEVILAALLRMSEQTPFYVVTAFVLVPLFGLFSDGSVRHTHHEVAEAGPSKACPLNDALNVVNVTLAAAAVLRGSGNVVEESVRTN